MFDIQPLLRENIRQLKPYSSARDEFSGSASVFLDANENPYNAPYNRYPDPLQWTLKEKISRIKNIAPRKIFLGNGSDEPIDLLLRAFCEPGIDNVVAIEPSYGMYRVAADVNNVSVKPALLNSDYSLNTKAVQQQIDGNTKLVFLCSPNNPTANLLDKEGVREILEEFKGIVVIDEAYIDFSPEATWLNELSQYKNLVVLQTLSKAWGMAGIRLGMAFASDDIIGVLNKIKYPYNINMLTQKTALELLKKEDKMVEWVKTILAERSTLNNALSAFSFVQKIYPSDANFLLVKVDDANATYEFLMEQSVIVRNRTSVTLCEGCLRITVGTPDENRLLLEALTKFSK